MGTRASRSAIRTPSGVATAAPNPPALRVSIVLGLTGTASEEPWCTYTTPEPLAMGARKFL